MKFLEFLILFEFAEGDIKPYSVSGYGIGLMESQDFFCILGGVLALFKYLDRDSIY